MKRLIYLMSVLLFWMGVPYTFAGHLKSSIIIIVGTPKNLTSATG